MGIMKANLTNLALMYKTKYQSSTRLLFQQSTVQKLITSNEIFLLEELELLSLLPGRVK